MRPRESRDSGMHNHYQGPREGCLCDWCEIDRAKHRETCQALVNIGNGVLIAHLAAIAEALSLNSNYRNRAAMAFSALMRDECGGAK